MTKAVPEYSGDPTRFTDRLLDWLDESGSTVPAASDLNVLEHGLRTATLAREERASEAEVVAALLHEVGLILLKAQGPDGVAAADRCGEIVGAAWLARYFRPAVSEPVRLHQIARRWLFAMDKGYRDALSDETFRLLASLGGPMGESERQQFERYDHWGASVALARRTDLSPSSDIAEDDLTALRPAILNCLAPQMNSQVA